ncbi:MAG: immunoglobulin domain-containing protein [Planctomycetota bacterium]
MMQRPAQRFLGWLCLPILCVLFPVVAVAADINAVIDFDFQSLPAGTVLSSVTADDGGSGVGPIGVDGELPSDPTPNRALIFDSANPTGGDQDLGTPHQDFGGPGNGPGGAAGSPFQNDTALNNILIIAEDLVDSNNDNLVDDPDDATEQNMMVEFDFTTINAPFTPTDVSILAITTIDGESSEAPGTLRLYDSSNTLLGTFPLMATGCNGVRRHVIGAAGIGIAGVTRATVELDGSGGIDNLEFKIAGPMPDPTCDISPTNMFSVEVGNPVTFTVTGTSNADDCDANGIPDACDPDCNANGIADACDITAGSSLDMNGNGIPDECEGCSSEATILWDFNKCYSQSSGGSSTNYHEFDADVGGVCQGSVDKTSIVDRDSGAHSCTDDRFGSPGDAMCIGAPDIANFVADHPEAIRFSVDIDSPGQLTGMTFWDLAPTTYIWSSSSGSNSGPNDPPTLFGVRILKNGTQIFQSVDIATSTTWSQQVFDFSSDSNFAVTSGTDSFEFEILPYALQGTGASVTAWDIDDLELTLCCDDCDADGVGDLAELDCEPDGIPDDCEPAPDCDGNGNGDSMTITAVGLPSGATMTPSLPAGPQLSPISSTFNWTPGPGDEGMYHITYTITDGMDCLPATSTTCEVWITVVCSLSVSDPADLTVCENHPATFSVSATGTAPISYQWRFNGSNIPGATSDTLTVNPAMSSDAGSYDCVVSNPCENITTGAAVLTVNTDAVIVTSPSDETVCAGDSVTFTATADGSPTPTFQWRKDGTNIPGATGASLTINPVGTGDAGSYDVVVTNVCDSDTSDPAVLTVRVGPSINSQPQSVTICDGGSASFSVMASGSAPLSYQWRKNGMNIPGATGASLTINPAGTGDAGTYDVVVSNDCGSATSSGAVLVVNSPPTITAQPTGGTLCEGDPITFTVAASGTAPLSYQWRKDGTNIPGANGASYSIAAVATGDAGSYDVLVTNLCGSAVGGPAVLVVRTPPAITTHPQPVTVCAGGMATFDVTATGSAPLSYQWRKDGTNIPGATGSSFTINPVSTADAGTYDVVVTNDCGMATAAGAALVVDEAPVITAQPADATLCEGDMLSLSVTATGTPPISYQWRKDGTPIPGATGSSLTINPVSTTDAGSYDVVVTNHCGSETSTAAVVVVRTAPAIMTEPQDVTACHGEMVMFSVTATGTAPLSYQWRKDGVPIPGATGSSLTINPVSVGDAGTYDVVVTNVCGMATSMGAVLVVNVAPTITVDPMGATVCVGDPVSLSVTAMGTAPLSYQWRKDGTPIPGATGSSLSFAAATVGDAGSYDVVVSNLCGDATSAAAVVVVNTPPAITTDPQSMSACTGDSATFTVTATGTAPLSYQWRKDGMNIPGATSDTFTINPVSVADAGTYDVVVTNVCGMATSAGAVFTVNEPPTITVDPADTTACEGDSVTLSVTATGTMPLTYQWRKDGTPIPGATGSSLTFNPVATADAGSYDVMVTNVCDTVTSAAAVLTVLTAPTITVNPVDTSACVGAMASFSVTATGSAPLTYQWRFNGMPIPGATSANLTINPVGLADGGNYDVVVSNSCGDATSTVAVLTVQEAPTITTDPAGMTVCAGDNVTFSVTATGTAPLSFQWRLNGTDIPGATNSTLMINNVAVGDAGNYDVVVTNVCGSDTSQVAALVVQTAPVIDVVPLPITACPGDSVTFTASASGDPTPTVQWQFNGTDIPGATGNSFTINPVSPADGGSYTFVATNACGTATSAAAVLTVNEPVVITGDPADATVCVGDPVTFTVTATGTGPLTYQWRKDGIDIPGANAASLTIDPVGTGDAGSYDVIVTGACGSVTSGAAILSVQEAPVITVDPVAQFICIGDPVTFTVTATGTAPLTYQWKFNGSDIPGAHSDTLMIAAVAPGDGGNYSVMVMNNCGSATSAGAALTVEEPPGVVSHPQGANVCPPMTSLTLSVMVSGTPPFEYRWRKDGVQLPGETGSTLTLDPFDPMSDPGNYDVVVSNDCGSVISDPALVEADCDIPFVRGDCNDDGIINIADAVKVLRVLYQGLDVGGCIDACDSNDDGLFDISDTIYTVFYQFTGGPPPTSPFPSCGLDPTPDTLECMQFNCP